MARKVLVKPKPKTLRKAEKELHGKRVPKTAKSTAGYTVRNAKGVREKRTRSGGKK